MPKGNNGNLNCQRRSNCCPGGIEEQQPVEKQLSSIPEESSRKLEATESVQAKVELFERKSRGSQEVHEKAVREPLNTASQEVHEEAEQPKKSVKKTLKRPAKNPKKAVKSKKPKIEKAEQPKKPVKKPLKRLANKPKKAISSKKPKDEKAKQPKKAVKKPVNTASQEVHEKSEQPKQLVKKPDNTASQEVHEKAEKPKKPVKKPLKRLAKKPKKVVKSKNPKDDKAEEPKKPVKKPVNTSSQDVHEKSEQPKKPVKKPLKRLAKKPKKVVKSKNPKDEKAEEPKKPVKKPANTSSQDVHEKSEQPKKLVKRPDNTASQEVHEKAEKPKKPVKKPLKRLAKKPKKAVKSKNPKEEKAEQPKKPVKKPVNAASQEVDEKAEQSKKLVRKPLKKFAKKPKKAVKSKKPKDEQSTLNSVKEAETPQTVGKSGMDDKKAQIGDVSAKDLFKAIQFAAIKQKNQRSYMSEYKLPSINIDIAMANMLAKAGEKDKVLLQAIFLHDLVDWTNTSLEEIKEEFGASVASVVEEVTSIDKGGKFDRELGGKASKEAVSGLSKNGQLIRLSDLLWQMTMLVEASEERELTIWEKQRIADAKEEMAHYGKDTNSNIFAALDKAMDILIKSSIM